MKGVAVNVAPAGAELEAARAAGLREGGLRKGETANLERWDGEGSRCVEKGRFQKREAVRIDPVLGEGIKNRRVTEGSAK